MAELTIDLEISDTNLIQAFRRLPPSKREELLRRLGALSTLQVRALAARSLHELTGLVAVGGDALVDTEAIYDDDRSN